MDGEFVTWRNNVQKNNNPANPESDYCIVILKIFDSYSLRAIAQFMELFIILSKSSSSFGII